MEIHIYIYNPRAGLEDCYSLVRCHTHKKCLHRNVALSTHPKINERLSAFHATQDLGLQNHQNKKNLYCFTDDCDVFEVMGHLNPQGRG